MRTKREEMGVSGGLLHNNITLSLERRCSYGSHRVHSIAISVAFERWRHGETCDENEKKGRGRRRKRRRR